VVGLGRRFAAILASGTLLVGFGTAAAHSRDDPVTNPALDVACDLDATLLVDASGGIPRSAAATQIAAAATGFLATLQDTGSTGRVVRFATLADDLVPRSTIDAASLAPGGAFPAGLARFPGGRPGLPDGVAVYRHDGRGDLPDTASYTRDDDALDSTNWDAGLERGVEPGTDLLVLVTDGGRPTAFDLDQPGDPFDPGPPPDVAAETAPGSAADETLARAVAAADRVKQHARILVVAVGLAASEEVRRRALEAVSGPRTVVAPDPQALPPIGEMDVVLLRDWDDLEPFLTRLGASFCASSVAVRVESDGPGDAVHRPVPGRRVTVSAGAPGVAWVLPAPGPAPEAAASTDEAGRAVFQWRPDRPTTTVTVGSQLPVGYQAGRPGEPDYRCRAESDTGQDAVVEGEFTDPGSASFDLDVGARQRVRCTLATSFRPRPALALEQAVSATAVRGDLTPPARVAATFRVTNTGNVPVSGLRLAAAACRDPAAALPGHLLAPGETRTATCGYDVRADATGRAPDVLSFPAEVSASDPFGTRVSAAAGAAVVAYRPGVVANASVRGRAQADARRGGEMTLAVDVTASGDAGLADLDVAGDPCPLRPGRQRSPGVVVPPAATVRLACAFGAERDQTLELSVTALPVTPGGAPIAAPNPRASARDSVSVRLPAPPARPTSEAPPTPSPPPTSSPRPTPGLTPTRSAAASPPPAATATRTPTPTVTPSPSPTTTDLPAAAPGAPDLPFRLDVTLQLEQGQPVAGRTLRTLASRLLPGSPVTATVYSQAQLLFAEPAAADGSVDVVAPLPAGLPAGPHTVIVSATSAAGRDVTVAGGFTLDDEGRVAAVAQPRRLTEPEPGDPRVLRALALGRPPYDARQDPVTTAAVLTTGALVVGLAGAGIAAPAVRRQRRKASVKGVIAKRIKSLADVPPGPGDLSRTWRWPFTDRTDAFARWLPTLWASRTVVIARLGLEGTWARAMFGSLGYLPWLAAAGLGLVAGTSGDGGVGLPALPVLLALVVLGVLDASAGAVGWGVLCLTALLTGRVGTADDVRTLLGLGSLLTWPALLTHAIRPLRRPGWQLSVRGREERVVDYLVPPILVAFLAGGVAKALNGLSGLELVLASDITAVRWAAGVAVVARYAVEDVAALRYPLRTQQLAPPKVQWPDRPWSVVGIVLRFAVFLFVAEPFFGLTAATLVAGLLTALPCVLGLWEDDLPDSPTVGRWLPRGMLKVVVLVVGCAVLASILIGDGGDAAVRSTMLLMLLPGLAFALVELWGRTRPAWPDTRYKRAGGAATWLVLAGLTTGTLVLFG
jgi:hypothetical protein